MIAIVFNLSIVGWLLCAAAFGFMEWLGLRKGTDREYTASHLIRWTYDRHWWFRIAAWAGYLWLGWHLFGFGHGPFA